MRPPKDDLIFHRHCYSATHTIQDLKQLIIFQLKIVQLEKTKLTNLTMQATLVFFSVCKDLFENFVELLEL